MTLIKTGIIALALTASLGALASPASAATRAERNAAAREARAQAENPYRVNQQRYLPAAGQWNNDRSPNHCRTDDGYGRYDTCDH